MSRPDAVEDALSAATAAHVSPSTHAEPAPGNNAVRLGVERSTPLAFRANAVALPEGLALVPVDHIHADPLQPRVNVSVELVRRLAESMRAGRHDPLLEVEPAPLAPGHYQIVCGEQRWRAARQAGIEEVLVRVHRRLGYLERLRKQYEENHLRADLDPVEDAHLVLLAKVLRDTVIAEQLLHQALVPFQPLDDKEITDRAQIYEHLEGLKALLLKRGVNVVKTERGLAVGPLSPWRETEEALGIGETMRKAKLAILRLEPDVLEEAHALPAQHASLIAQVQGQERRAQLVGHAGRLSSRQLHAVVHRLRRNPALTVEDAIAGQTRVEPDDPLAFDLQIARLTDLCRQVVRTLANLRRRVSADEKDHVRAVLADLRHTLAQFEDAA